MPRYNPRTGALETYQPGPFAQRHFYLQWGGKLPGGEVWSCGLRLRSTAPDSAINDDTALTGYKNAVQAFHVHVQTQISPRALLSFVKCNLVGTDGKYVDPVTHQILLADIPGGGTASLTPANQIAWAVTLETGFSRGPAHRGRFYIPLPTVPIDTDGRVTTGTRDPLKTQALALVTALNAVTTNNKVAVFSRKNPGATQRDVTTVNVGRVVDTVRRRRNKLLEAY